ncbi:zinc-dependent metalloprotease [Sphingomonas sp. DT-204]|uniref:zinc-dependent metalloprotease n=1 Tax=Sphingomonas sp. DT-204 TaxID=3396166 RepID=UPI003F19CAC1
MGSIRNFKLAAAASLLAATAGPLAPAAAAQRSDAALLPVKVEAATGRILVTLPPPGPDGSSGRFLYASALRTGLGSAPIRLDHAMNGPTEVLAFRRYGRKMAVLFENPRFRATGGAEVQRGARESFPASAVWMTDVISTAPDGSVVIDLASFLTRDAVGIAKALNSPAGGGKGFKLAEALSAADPASVKVFPDNIEMEAIQTYQSDTPGEEVSEIAPDPRQVSLVVHHSLIRLPAPGYRPRRFDIRSSANGTQVFDFGTPLGQDVVYALANRFRLEKVDPAAPRSRVKKPIVFYIDTAAPEPVRTALAEGVGWWSQAFDAAGLIDAFQVRMLPPEVDPLDVRYNVVNWGNRLTRSWSYGQAIIDPRTGEIVKSSVVLGSLRVRQDMVIFESLVGAGETNGGSPSDPVQVSLARLRQLGAHEVGHALGFMHNFAGSTQGRTSVMDYPGPNILLKDGRIDLSDAYASGIGTWDKFAVDWLYADPAPGIDPDQAADAKARAAEQAGMRFVTDIDGRSVDGPSPWGSMWDNGPDPAAELVRMMEVRRVAIAGFGPHVLRQGEPLSNLRRKFVPVWLLHRYQVDAAAKLVGGVDLSYAVAGDGRPPASPVPAAAQNAAIDALTRTLGASELHVPDPLVGMLSSGINGRPDVQFDREVFRNAGSAAFDPLVATDVAAQVTLDALLAPNRLARLYIQHIRDPELPGLETMLDRLTAATLPAHMDETQRRIAYRTLLTMARTAREAQTAPEVAAILSDRVQQAADRFRAARGTDGAAAWARGMGTMLDDPDLLKRELDRIPRVPEIPPGMPIGGAETDWFSEFPLIASKP